ncbi:hypothetical protein H1C71_008025 [Ictidomys tridecemlineatus]|nr:hypothetical protein H1C71_008025 [Ictidomys tridecemlineatus]
MQGPLILATVLQTKARLPPGSGGFLEEGLGTCLHTKFRSSASTKPPTAGPLLPVFQGGCGVTCCRLAEGRTRAQGGSARWDGAWSSSGLEVGLGQQGQAPSQRADATPQGHTWECRGLGAAPWWGKGYRPVACGLQR